MGFSRVTRVDSILNAIGIPQAEGKGRLGATIATGMHVLHHKINRREIVKPHHLFRVVLFVAPDAPLA